MTVRSVEAGAGFNWLMRGVGAGFRQPKLFGGAAVLVVACFVPSLITMPLQMHAVSTSTPMSMSMTVIMMALSMLVSLLLVPMYAGYLQIVAAAERGLPFAVLDMFRPYRSREAFRLLGFGLALLLVYLVMIGIVLAITGGSVISWYSHALALQAQHQPPPGLPAGFGWFVALAMLIGLFVIGFYSIGLGQAALSQRSPFGAVGDGLLGAVKNVLPLFVFALTYLAVSIGACVLLIVAVLVLGFLAKLVGVWLMLALAILLYIALFLLVFTIMFGVMYHLWRDVCGDDTTLSVPPPFAA